MSLNLSVESTPGEKLPPQLLLAQLVSTRFTNTFKETTFHIHNQQNGVETFTQVVVVVLSLILHGKKQFWSFVQLCTLNTLLCCEDSDCNQPLIWILSGNFAPTPSSSTTLHTQKVKKYLHSSCDCVFVGS